MKDHYTVYIFSFFVGIQGNAIGDVKFNTDGDRIGRYSIFQYQRVTAAEGYYKYVWVGEFGEYPDLQFSINRSGIVLQGRKMRQELALDVESMRWPNVSRTDGPPKSVCSKSCPIGYVKSFVVSTTQVLELNKKSNFFHRSQIIQERERESDKNMKIKVIKTGTGGFFVKEQLIFSCNQ